MFDGRAPAADGLAECRMAGELDAAAAPEARALLARVPATVAVVVDLDRVRFVDSAGLGVLVTGVRNLREQGSVVVLSVARPNVRRLLGLVGLDRVVPMASSRAEARAQAAAVSAGVVDQRPSRPERLPEVPTGRAVAHKETSYGAPASRVCISST